MRLPALRRASCAAHGFTLFEMLAVILLLGIAAAAVSVSVSKGLAAARIRQAGSDVAAALRATRTEAIVRGEVQVFDFDPRHGRWVAAKGRAGTLPPGLEASITSAAEDQPDADTGRIRFFPDGSSTGGRITLIAGQREWHVNVAWLTGTVHVVEGR